MGFAEVLADTPVGEIAAFARRATDADVSASLARDSRDLWDFAALLSPAASARLEDLARASHALTARRFGKTVHMYAPIYLSNQCLSTCLYCGFARTLPIARKTLSALETMAEAGVLAAQGFRHVLLLTGEHERETGVDFLVERVRGLSPVFPHIALEVQVADEDGYRRLRDAGCDGIVVYQETYQRDTYATVHLAGRKRRYEWRLDAPERAGRAGIRRLGIGALLGLHDPWREEAVSLAAHARYLLKRFWRQELTVSVPRLRPSSSGYLPQCEVSDRDLTQLVCALRLLLPDVGIVLSTRESPELRDSLVRLGITHTSAGSHTEPGGYNEPGGADGQFEIADRRSAVEVAAAIRALGYEPVWKDWDPAMRATLGA